VEAATGGALTLTPMEADCRTAVGDWSSLIVDRDPATDGIQELKVWQALVGYVAALPDTSGDGVADLPVSYAEAARRITPKND
jgi:5'-nucleotidase